MREPSTPASEQDSQNSVPRDLADSQSSDESMLAKFGTGRMGCRFPYTSVALVGRRGVEASALVSVLVKDSRSSRRRIRSPSRAGWVVLFMAFGPGCGTMAMGKSTQATVVPGARMRGWGGAAGACPPWNPRRWALFGASSRSLVLRNVWRAGEQGERYRRCEQMRLGGRTHFEMRESSAAARKLAYSKNSP